MTKTYTGDKWVGSPEHIAQARNLGNLVPWGTCPNCYEKMRINNMRKHVVRCYRENGDMSNAIEDLAKKGSTFADKKKLGDILSKTGGVANPYRLEKTGGVDKYRKDIDKDDAFETETKDRIQEILEDHPIKDPIDDWRHSDANKEHLKEAVKNIGSTTCACGKEFDNRGFSSHKKGCDIYIEAAMFAPEAAPKPFVDVQEPPIEVESMYESMMEVVLRYVNITSVEDLNMVEEYIYEGIDMVDAMPLQKKEVG